MQKSIKIEIQNISHIFFGNNHSALQVLDNVSFGVNKGELLCLLGPSGCGKSTLLKIIAGFINPKKGSIVIDQKKVQTPSPDRILVFQDLYLFHWMTVLENVLFALKAKQYPKIERLGRANELIKTVGLVGFENYYPRQISGGMGQRLAIARSLAAEPSILLMDEPFGSLDNITRTAMEDELIHILEETNLTSIMVTHDVQQAIFLSDRILIMSPRPATIQLEKKISFLRPRSKEIRYSDDFHKIEKEIFSILNSSN
jgi:NitT/TauT family transport system ATP-binding protein